MPSSDPRQRIVWWSALAVVLGLALGLTVLSTDEPRLPHTSVLNVVFDTRWMVGAARLLAAAVFAYLVASVAVRVRRGQWIRSAGSVSSDVGPVEDLAAGQQDLEQQLRAARQTIDDLRGRLAHSLQDRVDTLASMDEQSARKPDEEGR